MHMNRGRTFVEVEFALNWLKFDCTSLIVEHTETHNVFENKLTISKL